MLKFRFGSDKQKYVNTVIILLYELVTFSLDCYISTILKNVDAASHFVITEANVKIIEHLVQSLCRIGLHCP